MRGITEFLAISDKLLKESLGRSRRAFYEVCSANVVHWPRGFPHFRGLRGHKPPHKVLGHCLIF